MLPIFSLFGGRFCRWQAYFPFKDLLQRMPGGRQQANAAGVAHNHRTDFEQPNLDRAAVGARQVGVGKRQRFQMLHPPIGQTRQQDQARRLIKNAGNWHGCQLGSADLVVMHPANEWGNGLLYAAHYSNMPEPRNGFLHLSSQSYQKNYT